jgi:hypothetical protein
VATTNTITSANGSTFTTSAGTYQYSSSDVYQLVVNGVCTTDSFSDFQARLSTGDQLQAGSFYNAPNQSTFCLNDIAPVAPTGTATAGPGTANSANAGKAGTEVSWAKSTTTNVTSYNVYRATAVQPTIAGQQVTCPTLSNAGSTASPQTPPASSTGYAKIGTVQATATTFSGKYVFLDSTATVPPTATPNNPSYCYTVTAVGPTANGGTQESSPSNVAGPTAATAATTATTFGYATTSPVVLTSPTTADITFNGNANPLTIETTGPLFDFGGANTYSYSSANPTVHHAVTVTGETANGSDGVTLTFNALTAGDDVLVVAAQNGTDGNTVCAASSTTNCLAVGAQAQGAVGTPTVTTVSGSSSAVTSNWNESVDFVGTAGSDIKVITGGTCASPTGTPIAGSSVNGSGTSTLTITLASAMSGATGYTLCIAPSAVQDSATGTFSNAQVSKAFTTP